MSELLSPIATTAFQTVQGHKSKLKRQTKDGQKKLTKKPGLLGTCHAFNPKSEVVKRLWPDWYKN